MIESKQLIIDENVEKLFDNDVFRIRSFLVGMSAWIRLKYETMGIVRESALYNMLEMPYTGSDDKAIVSDVDIETYAIEEDNISKIKFVLKYDVEED